MSARRRGTAASGAALNPYTDIVEELKQIRKDKKEALEVGGGAVFLVVGLEFPEVGGNARSSSCLSHNRQFRRDAMSI